VDRLQRVLLLATRWNVSLRNHPHLRQRTLLHRQRTVTTIDPGSLGTITKTTLCVAAGADISATANGSSFEIGSPPLLFISGTNTVTDNGTTASTTLASGATCIFACCPFTGGGGCSGLTNPCP
jgi:hypothetical protein